MHDRESTVSTRARHVADAAQDKASARDAAHSKPRTDLDEAKLLQAISARLIGEDDADALQEAILDAAIAIMRSDMGSLQVFFPERSELQLIVWRGFHPESAKFWEWVPSDSSGSCGRAVAANARVVVPDTETCAFMAGTEDLEHFRLSGIRAMQSTPLVARSGRLLGMISTHWRTPHDPSQRDLGLLDVVARQAADLIERRHAEAALRDSSARLAALLNQAATGIAHTDAEGRFIFVNDRYCEIVGRSREELLTLRMQDITHPDDLPRNLDLLAAAASSGGAFVIEKRYVLPGGSVVWVENAVKALHDANGEFESLFAVTVDLTARKAAEADRDRSESLLRAQAEQLRLVQAAGGIGSFDWDMTTGRIHRSPEYLALHGLPAEAEVDGDYSDAWIDRIHPDDRDKVVRWFKADVATCASFDREYRVIRASDGETRWIHNRGMILAGADGKPARLLSAQTDVTERRAADEALRDSERRLRELLEALPVAVYTTDAEGHITYFNEAAVALSGRTPTIGSDLWCVTWRLYRPDGSPLPHDECPMAVTVKENRPVRGTVVAERPDGTRVPVLVYPTPLRDADGALIGAINTLVDISERERAEQAMRMSEARFREQFENANDFIFTTDLDLRVTSCNPAVGAAINLAPEALLGRSISEFVTPEMFERNKALLAEKLAGGDATRYEAEIFGPSGEPQTWEINSRLTRDADGNPYGLHAIGRDITERKQHEQHQRLLIDELNHRVKNSLAVVQAIAQQTFAGDGASDAARQAFDGRLGALATAHGLLSRRNWEAADLEEIAHDALRAVDDASGRLSISGPPVRLAPKTAVTISMALHELSTNASKYGALSNARGRVALSWTTTGGERPQLSLRWEESGGPAVTPPARRSFGSRMIERALAAELGGTAVLQFLPDGVVCVIDAQLPPSETAWGERPE